MSVGWTEPAEQDVYEILAYVSEHSPAGAAKIDRRFQESADLLEVNPFQGRIGRLTNTRELVVTGLPYLIVYRVVGRDAEILRVIHTSRDWPGQL